MSTLKVNKIIPTAGVPTGGGGGIVQVVQAVKTDTASTTSSTKADISGLTPTITLTSTSSKLLIIMDVKIGVSNYSDDVGICFNRSISGGASSEIYVGDTSSSRRSATHASEDFFAGNGDHQMMAIQSVFLDSPNTTSQITYSLKWNLIDGGTIYINRDGDDNDDNKSPRLASSLTLMEVSA